MRCQGWTLLFHACLVEQLQKLQAAALRAEKNASQDFAANANVKLLCALMKLMQEVVPADPAKDEYRQGSTLGHDYRHWRRVKFGQRFRLFFRYDSKSKIIVFAWGNDENTLRAAGSNPRRKRPLSPDL